MSTSQIKAHNDNSDCDDIERTRDVWRPRLGRDVSDDEAKQIAETFTSFFSILAEWADAHPPSPANDNAVSDCPQFPGGRSDS